MAILIDIKPGNVSVTGSSRHVITDADVQSFGIYDNALKNAVQAYFGQRPNDAYLKSPTPWGDLYSTYGWSQVQTVLVVQSSTITEDSSKPVMLDYQNFVNNSSTGEATYTANMSRQKTNSASNTWSNTHSIKIEQKIEYKIDFGVSVGGETSLSYEYAFGESGTQSTTTTLTSGSGVTVTVGPNQTKHAILSASQGQMKVRIVYKAYLIGSTAVNYNPTYKGHHCFSLGIDGVMSSGNISNNKTITEDIVLDYYSSSSVVVGDGPAPTSVTASVAK